MESVVGFARFFALNGATALAACAFASRLTLSSKSERLLAACVIGTGLANASALILGLLGQLHYGPLLGVQLVLALAGAAVGRWQVIGDFLDPRPAALLVTGPAQRAAMAMLLVVYVYVLFLGWLAGPFAGDELMYHLPLVAEYARRGAIEIPELGRFWGNRWWAYYPGGAYLIDLWFVLPFGNGALVDLVQFPFVFASALASYALARLIGATRRDAVWAAILFLAVPIVINQAKTAMVDVTLTFLYAAGLVFLLRQPTTIGSVALAAIAWGAAPGVKLPAMMFMALGGICVALTCVDREKNIGAALRLLVPTGAAVALGVVLLSGYWFARNALLMGSPVYPLNLHPEPEPAWGNILVYGLFFPLLDFSPATPLVFNYETGAGPQFICLAVPATIALAISGWRRRRFGEVAFALLPIVAYVIWLVRLSTSVQTLFRYVLPAMPLAFAAFAWLLPRLAQRRSMSALALASVALSVFLAVPRLGTYTNTESLRRGVAKWRRGEAIKPFDLMGSVDLQDFRRAWAYLESLPGHHDIAAGHLIFAYPMLGSDFRHQLHFIDEVDPGRWLAALRERRVDHVALAQLIDATGKLDLGEPITLSLSYTPATDEELLASRKVEPLEVQAIRLTYGGAASENARLLAGVNLFQQVWELPPPPPGESRTETLPWKGLLRSVDVALEFTGRTSLRTGIDASLAKMEVQGSDGEWTTLDAKDFGAWEILDWPLEYYWIEAHPERFKLVLRDLDTWRSQLSGEMRLYEVIGEGK